MPLINHVRPALGRGEGNCYQTVIALTPHPNATSLHEFVDNKPGPLALVFGAEGNGLPQETLSAADHQIRMPIARDVDSLNVGHAAAVAFALTSPK